MSLLDAVLHEFRQRRAQERAKAQQKYAAVGQLPGGDPARDVFDYAINELVGLLRYAEMMEHRLATYQDVPAHQMDTAMAVCRQLSAAASRYAIDLIGVRQRLLKRGIVLGKAEAA